MVCWYTRGRNDDRIEDKLKEGYMLHYCYNCKENSVHKKVYIRKRDGAKCLFERCINANPDCQYRNHRVLSQGGTNAADDQKRAETPSRGTRKQRQQLAFDFSREGEVDARSGDA